MKRLIPLLAIAPLLVNAHGMYPTGKVEPAYPVSSFHKVDLTLTNTNDSRMCYDVEINGKLMTPYASCLNPSEAKKLSVYVDSPPNQWALNEVCTLSPMVGSFRSRMCVEVQSYYLQQ